MRLVSSTNSSTEDKVDDSGNMRPQQVPTPVDDSQQQQRGAAEAYSKQSGGNSEALEASTMVTAGDDGVESGGVCVREVVNKGVQVEFGGGFHEQEALLLEKASAADVLREEVEGLKASLEVSF